MIKKTIIIATALAFSGSALANINEFRDNKPSMNVEFKYSKFDLEEFSKELASLAVETKLRNNVVLGGELGIFEDNENFYDLNVGYRIHYARNIYIQGRLGYTAFDFNDTSGQDLDTKYGKLELGYRYTNGIKFNVGVERHFPSEENSVLGIDTDFDMFGSASYNFMDNMYLNVSYKQLYKQYGVGLVWNF